MSIKLYLPAIDTALRIVESTLWFGYLDFKEFFLNYYLDKKIELMRVLMSQIWMYVGNPVQQEIGNDGRGVYLVLDRLPI